MAMEECINCNGTGRHPFHKSKGSCRVCGGQGFVPSSVREIERDLKPEVPKRIVKDLDLRIQLESLITTRCAMEADNQQALQNGRSIRFNFLDFDNIKTNIEKLLS